MTTNEIAKYLLEGKSCDTCIRQQDNYYNEMSIVYECPFEFKDADISFPEVNTCESWKGEE